MKKSNRKKKALSETEQNVNSSLFKILLLSLCDCFMFSIKWIVELLVRVARMFRNESQSFQGVTNSTL